MTARSVQIFQILLSLYPNAFRRRYGAEMTLLFRDCLRDASPNGTQGLAGVWLATVMDLTTSAPRAHLEEWSTVQASYTHSSRLGAVVAIATALGFIGLIAGFIDVNRPGNAAATLVMTLFSLTWFGMLWSLYRRIEAASPSPENRASLAVGGFALFLLLAATGLNAMANASGGALAAVGVLVGVVSLALLGLSSNRLPELGPWRRAPLLSAVPAALFLFTWFVMWNWTLVVTAAICAVISFVGTAVLLWTTAGTK